MYFYKNLEKRKRWTKNVIKFQFVRIKALFRSKGGGGARGSRRDAEGAEMGEFWQKAELTRYGKRLPCVYVFYGF